MLSHAVLLIAGGLVAGNVLLVLLLGFSNLIESLAVTSAVMLVVGLFACIQPARRALRIDPADALRDT